MANTAERLVYAVGQAARVGWYVGQGLAAARLAGPAPRLRGSRPQEDTAATRPPPISEILADLRDLLARDWANIAAGIYRMPEDLVRDPRRLLAEARRFFADLPQVRARRRQRDGAEVVESPPPGSAALPRYYRQNFHFQTDGYLSDRSAALYDHQVEVLFGGGAGAMRRQALVPLAAHFRGRDTRRLRLLDVAAGTGRFLREVKANWPRLDVTALDLSRPYLAEARRALAPWSGANTVLAPAEAMPFADGGFDAVTCIYLFHELPGKVRAAVAAEMARVLKPGGLLVLVDSLQLGDKPRFDPLLAQFPVSFHEPYFADYVRQDLGTLFADQGLVLDDAGLAFMSKIVVFRKVW